MVRSATGRLCRLGINTNLKYILEGHRSKETIRGGLFVFFRLKRTRGVEYLQLVENSRRGARISQTVLASLGRLDALRANGSLDRLIGAGASLCERGLFLAPPVFKAKVELAPDEELHATLLDLVERLPRCADVLSAFYHTRPEATRRLVAAATFGGLSRATESEPFLQHLVELGHRSDNPDEGDGVTALSLGPAATDSIAGDGLVLGVRAAGAGPHPSLMRGLVSFLAALPDGAPLAAGHWPAHLPPLQMAYRAAALLTRWFDLRAGTIVFDRSFTSDAFLSVLAKAPFEYIAPVRETTRPSSNAWSCHDVRPPNRETGAAQRFVQISDGAAADRDRRLRHAQLERLKSGPPADAFPRETSRLHAARQAIIEAERWDGITLLATNLTVEPQEVARRYLAARSTRAWEHEMTAFGQQLLDHESPPRETAAILAGGAGLLLVASFLRHALTRHAGHHHSWDEISAALTQHRAVQLRQDRRAVLLAPEPPPILAGLLNALNAPQAAARRSSRASKPTGNQRKDVATQA